VIIASILLSPSAEAVSLFGVEVPPLCVFTNLFGLDCFGCGLTRSFTYMGHGDIEGALDLHMLGPFLYVFVAAQVPLRVWRVWNTREDVQAPLR